MNGKVFENMPSGWWFEAGRMLMSALMICLSVAARILTHLFGRNCNSTSILTLSLSLVVFLAVIAEF